jgi:hypothetical protein
MKQKKNHVPKAFLKGSSLTIHFSDGRYLLRTGAGKSLRRYNELYKPQ